MTAFYRNQGYEEEPDYPDYSNSRGFRSHSHHRNYPDTLNNPDYPGAEDYLDNPGFRNHQENPGFHTNPAFSRSQGTPDYPGPRKSSYHSRSRHNPDSFNFLMIPDYPGAEDSRDSRENPDDPGSGNNAYRSSSKNYPDRPGSLGIPDYPGAEDNLGTPNNWRSAYNQDRENNHDYSYSENLEMGRRSGHHSGLFHQTSGSPGRGNRDYPESFQMISRQPTSLYSKHPVPGPSDGGYRNIAYEDESSLDEHYGNQHLGREVNSFVWRRNWYDDDLLAYDPTFGTIAEKIKHEEKLVASLVNLTARDRNKIIRNQPLTIQEKREIKKKVNMEKRKSGQRSVQLNFCTQCLTATALHYRHFRSAMSEFFQSLHVWQRTLKIIGSKFGTSVLSYFGFLSWLLKFSIFSFIVNFSFIIIPQLIESKPNNLSFTSLELLSGAGYFQETVMYYGFYTNSTIKYKGVSTSYNMQLAYIFTIGLYLVVCFFSLLYSMACSFRNNFINPHIYSRGTAKLVFSWDFTITHEKAVKLKQKNLSTELKENLSEIRHENVIAPLKQRLYHLCIHLAAWIVSTGVAVVCCVAVYFLAFNNMKFLRDHNNQGATLLLPFVVCCINLFVPLFYSSFGLVEKFEIPRHQVLVIITRNIFLKISIIGILCYYWLNSVAVSNKECWETHVGQDIYRLLMMNFLFALFDSILGEFLRRIIGTKFIKSLGVPEFDIARNVLELIYTQTLLWIGIFFSPLLPLIHMVTLFIMFYVKRISLLMNCQPPSKAWRASQMMTLFIFLLFFPSFTGVLCVLAITVWRLKPSAHCGPFQGLPSIIHAIYGWIEILSSRPSYLWVVWIYRNLIGSVHFFFILTLLVLMITYLYWQIIEGRKIMIKLLHEQIINEGKDKMFLVEKLSKLLESQKKSSNFTLAQERREQEMELRNSLDKSMDLSKRSRTSLRNQNSVFMEEEYFNHDTRQHTAITDEDSSEALRLAMMARRQ
ncbi:transmembrane channel-like protein 5 isoform X2 [Notamacropus eugenii]|uniref:transmembrane channel-like protein 5 isoform X2 n=1 Tax=Notamacropus eugenii TaxID=9315 RepID=UPI003B66F203